MDDLTADLGRIESLTSLRREIESLRDDGLRAISCFMDSPDHWDTPDSSVSKLLCRRAKHLAWSLGLLPSDRFEQWPQWVSTCALQPIGNRRPPGAPPEATRSPEEEDLTPFKVSDSSAVLVASTLLRARLDALPQRTKGKVQYPYVNEDMFRSFYRIVRELYFVEAPDWALGGAQIGSAAGIVSVFITSECARALGHAAKLLVATADLLSELSRAVSYQDKIGQIPTLGIELADGWFQREKKRMHLSLKVTLESFRHRTLIAVPDLGEDNHDALMKEVWRLMRLSCRATVECVNSVTNELVKFREWEQESHDQDYPNPEIDKQDANKISNYDLSATAHGLAYGFLKRVGRALSQAECVLDNTVPSSDQLSLAAGGFRETAARVRELMKPIADFMKARLTETILRVETSGVSTDLQDLSFTAACSLAISGNSNDPVYRKALGLLVNGMDEHGHLPMGNPFDEGKGGRQRHAVNAHALRSLAQIVEHCEVPIEETVTVTQKTVRFFSDTCTPVHGGRAWCRGVARPDGPASTWVTAVTVLTLDRFRRMLDKKINGRVAQHLSMRTAESLRQAGKPAIDQLMCSDVGLASLGWGERPRDTTVMQLERLRAHLLGAKDLVKGVGCSTILYGPPGTGKTTLVESLAITSDCDLFVVTPGDFLMKGAEALERQAKAVMRALCLLRRCVILFDEFDSVLYSREEDERGSTRPVSNFDFLTGGMLPKLADLNQAAKSNRLVYVLATNYVERLDSAATRPGRFDNKRCVHYPDPASRACRLVYHLSLFRTAMQRQGDELPLPEDFAERVFSLVARTGYVPLAVLCKSGLFTAPEPDEQPGPVWAYLLGQSGEPEWPMPSVSAPRVQDSSTRVTELLVTQAAEGELVRRWNRWLWEEVSKRGAKPDSWSRMLRFLTDPSEAKPVLDSRLRQLAELREAPYSDDALNDFELKPHSGETRIESEAGRNKASRENTKGS